jgi:tRNA pseudouridine synthase 10
MLRKTVIDYMSKLMLKNLDNLKICDNCLSRFIINETDIFSNKEKLSIISQVKHRKVQPKDCNLCEGITNEINIFTDLLYDSLKGYEFDTFLIGCKVDEDIIEKENRIISILGESKYESIKIWLKREIGRKLEIKLKKEVNFENPTIMAVLDTQFNIINLQIKPLFIYGFYNKFRRDIPQTRWFCRICRGKGCRRCNYTGKMYKTSVEEMISNESMRLAGGTEVLFHGAGREDIDVRMLGRGRPFVIEVKNPKKRKIDLKKLSSLINECYEGIIKVDNFRFSNKAEIIRIKNSQFKKVYKVKIIAEELINIEKLKKAAQRLLDKPISQFTPSRVALRRANIDREKKVYKCDVESVHENMAILTLETDSGTYIKELITGDDGKTKPSLSELIGVPCTVSELDVLEIKGE